MRRQTRGGEAPDPAEDGRVVKTVRVIAHRGGHWSIVLDLENGQPPRNLNMKIGNENDDQPLPGKLDWTQISTRDLQSHFRCWDYSIRGRVTVQEIHIFVKDQHLDAYDFIEIKEGGIVVPVGCRFWVYTTINLFVVKGFLEQQARVHVTKILKDNHSEHFREEQMTIWPGKFHFRATNDPVLLSS